MGLGILLMLIGFVFMAGGSMPSPDVWDESIIYGFRRTVLAPILILGGLVVQIYAIFKKYNMLIGLLDMFWGGILYYVVTWITYKVLRIKY